MLRKIIKIPIYNCKVVVYMEEDINDICRALHQKFGYEDDGGDADGCVLSSPNNITTYYLLLGLSTLEIDVFIHEVTHLSIQILNHRGHDSLKEGDEPLAYLSGYIATALYKLLIKNNIEFKRPKIRNAKKS